MSGSIEKPSRPAEIAYGTVKVTGGAVDIRITKGKQKLKSLGLKSHDNVLIVGAPGEALVAIPLPKIVIFGVHLPEILEKIGKSIDAYKAEYESLSNQPQRIADSLADYGFPPKVKPLAERRRKRTQTPAT